MCDGVVGAVQERMKAEFQTTSSHIMQAMSAWSILFLAIGVTVTGEIWQFILFMQRHPNVVYQLVVYYAAGALGQVNASITFIPKLLQCQIT